MVKIKVITSTLRKSIGRIVLRVRKMEKKMMKMKGIASTLTKSTGLIVHRTRTDEDFEEEWCHKHSRKIIFT